MTTDKCGPLLQLQYSNAIPELLIRCRETSIRNVANWLLLTGVVAAVIMPGAVFAEDTGALQTQQLQQQTDTTVVTGQTADPQAEVFESPETATAAENEITTFDIVEFRVRGNTLLNKADVERTVYPYLGNSKTIDDIEAARLALEQHYRSAGFPTVLVDIPEQDVNNGIVVLKVTEAKVEQITITGAKYYSPFEIRSKIPALEEGQAIYIPAVNQQIAAFNTTSANRSLTPILRPGRLPGTMEVELKVRDKSPLHGSLDVNNRNSDNTTDTRLGASLRYDNLWQKEHSFSLQYQTAPEEPDETRVWVGTYLARLPHSNALTAFYYVRSDSDIAATGTVDVIGKGDIFGARYILPVTASATYPGSVLLGVDYKDFVETTDISGVGSDTPIKYYNFISQYSGNVKQSSYLVTYNVGASFGLQSLNERPVPCEIPAEDPVTGLPTVIVVDLDQFACKRYGAKANYFYLRGELSVEWRIAYGISLYVAGAGQLADSPLISNEQFAIGGAKTVRGYYESQKLGDNGLTGTIELRSPSFGDLLSEKIEQFYFLIFADRGFVHNKNPLAGEQAKWYLGSAGVGLSFSAWKSLYGNLDWAYALEDSDPADTGFEVSVKKGDTRIHFAIEYTF